MAVVRTLYILNTPERYSNVHLFVGGFTHAQHLMLLEHQQTKSRGVERIYNASVQELHGI